MKSPTGSMKTRSGMMVGPTARQPLHGYSSDEHSEEEDYSEHSSSEDAITPGGEKKFLAEANKPRTVRKRFNPQCGPDYIPESAIYPNLSNFGDQLYQPQQPISSQRYKPSIFYKTTNWFIHSAKTYKWAILITVTLIVGIVYLATNSSVKPTASENNFDQFKDRILSIKQDFPSQLTIVWTAFLAGIRKVLFDQPPVPSIFLLLHHRDDTTTSCLARKVGRAAGNTFNASTPLFLDGANAQIGDYAGGEFTTHFGPLVKEHRIFIITNLHSMPANVSRSLHSFCDTVTPLVHEAVYIFTVTVDKPWREEDSGTKVAETVLDEAWKELDEDTRQALIVRVTSGQVLKINPEEGLTGCVIS